jgi:hypothetical protein
LSSIGDIQSLATYVRNAQILLKLRFSHQSRLRRPLAALMSNCVGVRRTTGLSPANLPHALLQERSAEVARCERERDFRNGSIFEFMEWPAPPSGVVGSPANQEEEGMDISVLGIDVGKNVCSVVGLDASGAVVMRRRMRRETLIGLAEKLPACVVGMEACCGSHHLGRVFASHGHDVRLMSPEYVRPYIKAQKNDDRDAEGIAEAATRPTMRFVKLKSQDSEDGGRMRHELRQFPEILGGGCQ